MQNQLSQEQVMTLCKDKQHLNFSVKASNVLIWPKNKQIPSCKTVEIWWENELGSQSVQKQAKSKLRADLMQKMS